MNNYNTQQNVNQPGMGQQNMNYRVPNPMLQSPMFPQPYQNEAVSNWNSPLNSGTNRPMIQNTWNSPPQVQLQQPVGIPGRTISDPQEIRPNEVPMDGSTSLFPMNDGSCIYMKAWGQDGTIQTIRYIPEKMESSSQQAPSALDMVIQRLDNIEKMLQTRKKSYYKKPNYNTQNKEVVTNE